MAWSAAEAAERLDALGRDVRAVREEERRYREAPRAKRKSMPPLDQKDVPARLHAEGKRLQEDRDRQGKKHGAEIQQAIRSLSRLVSEWNSPLMQESAVVEPEIEFLAEEYRGDVRAVPSGIDLALAKFARSVAQVAFPGGHVVEVLHGGHCTISGTGMAPLEHLRSSPVMRDFAWQAHHYVSPPLWQGTLEGRHGGSIHVHRQEGTAGRSEDDTVSVYFTPGCGRAAARKALEEAGFHNFEE